MKEYFFLKEKEQNGPFTIEQLSEKKLTNETLIWTEGMDNWGKLKDIPELVQTLKPKSGPPPLPIEDSEQNSKVEVSGHLRVTTKKTPNQTMETTLELIKPSRRVSIWLIVWCGFHLFALLMSYSRIEIFNNNGEPKSEAFWPFVKFQSCSDIIKWDDTNVPLGWSHGDGHVIGEDCHINGLFVDYDWTEFAFYVGSTIIIFLLVRISNSKKKTI